MSPVRIVPVPVGPSNCTATWPSVDQHPPAPEWYPRNMWISGSAENQHHVATYGDPSVWPFHNFINGTTDKAGQFTQFAPKLTSAGGSFDPTAWARLFAAAGAKFAGPFANTTTASRYGTAPRTNGTRSTRDHGLIW